LVWARARAFDPGPAKEPVTIVIPKGIGAYRIGVMLADANLVSSALLFAVETKLVPGPGLKAGEYALPAEINIAAILSMMRQGLVVKHRFTLAEGLTVAEVTALLTQNPVLGGPIHDPPKEGTLLPETYEFLRDDARDSLLARMEQAMTKVLSTEWVRRKPDLPLTSPEDALILASIVERETALPAERPRVAAVFENRLAAHMKLQSDPTVIYALTRGQGPLGRPLTTADLALNNPYNTYQIDGLPPAPICNPGKAAIDAVLHPAPVKDLYFVANGTGGHAFATNLPQHERNVEHWRQIEKQAAGN
jgi:UPF0755 protein